MTTLRSWRFDGFGDRAAVDQTDLHESQGLARSVSRNSDRAGSYRSVDLEFEDSVPTTSRTFFGTISAASLALVRTKSAASLP
jgi:hypothetical protein